MLLIDAGNSRVKCRQILNDQIIDHQFSLGAESDHGIESFNAYLATLNVSDAYLASVAEEHVSELVARSVQQVRPDVHFKRLFTLPSLGNVHNAYEDYTLLGVDRWLTLLAASDLVQHDVIILDAGSAITIDLLSINTGHLGGAILAGLKTDQLRFREIFARLDFAHADIRQTELPGRSTLECIHLTGDLDRIDYTVDLINRWSQLLNAPISILLCGQDAPMFAQRFQFEVQQIPDLVFRGMLKQIELQG